MAATVLRFEQITDNKSGEVNEITLALRYNEAVSVYTKPSSIIRVDDIKLVLSSILVIHVIDYTSRRTQPPHVLLSDSVPSSLLLKG